MASPLSSSPIQKLADSSSKKRTIAIQLGSLHSQAVQELAAAESKLKFATEASFAASEYLIGTKKKDKEIKDNLAYRFPIVRKKYAMLLANANTQLSLTKSDMASARSAMVTLSKKVQSSKKKSEEANKAADDAEKNFQDAVAQSEKDSTDTSVKDDVVVRETAAIVGAASKKQSSNLFRSIERTRDKSIDPTLERHILGDLGDDSGMGARLGVRQGAEEFAQQNPNIFRGDGLEANAARTMLEEAVILAESSLKSTPENAGKILGRLKYLEKVAMDAGDDVVAKKILEIIKPVKDSLVKKSSFLSLLKKSIGNKIGGFKSRMIQSIPIVGGLLESMREKKKDARLETEEYRDSINERISRDRQRGSSLDFSGKKSRGGGFADEMSEGDEGITGIMRGMGASPASELRGGGRSGGMGGGSEILEVLKSTHGKIVEITDLLHESIDPEESALKDRESEFEGRTLDGKKGGLASIVGGKEKEAGGGSFLGNLVQNQIIKRGGGLLKAGMGLLGMGGGAAAGGAAAGGAAAGGAAGGAAAGGGMFSRLLSGTKGLVGKGMGMVANMGKGAFKSAVGKLGSLSKLAPKLLKAVPGLGAAVQGIMSAVDISSIKSDPALPPQQKKAKIGEAIGSGLGGIIGSIGGGALGTLIPIPGIGTLIGAVGGGMVGNWLGELIASSLGGEGIYDMMDSIPGIGSLIRVDDIYGTETGEKALREYDRMESELDGGDSSRLPGSVGGAVGGTITPSTQTDVGKATITAGIERNNLENERATPMTTVGGNQTSNKQTNNISNTNTNIHVSEGTRNTEPTVKQMQREFY